MTQPGKDGVAQWGGAALPDLIEAMAGRSRQLWLRLVIGVLIACIVGPSLGAPLTVGWYVAWSLLQLAEVAWTRRAQRMSREQAVIGGVVLVALGSTVLAALGAAAILSGNSWLLVCGVWLLAGALLNACAASGTSPAIFWATAAPTFAGTLAVVLAAARAGAPAAMLCALTLSATLLFVAALAVRGVALRALQSARAASASKGAFLAQVSHEIRTPLNGVLGMAQIMSSGELSDEQRERLEVINRSGRALLSRLNDVLDISKIEAGKLTFDVRPFDLEQLALDLALAFDAAAGPGVGVCADLDAAIAGRWLGDETRTRQILTNLLSNAVKFTKAGEIRLTARVLDGGVELAVSDSGIGIPADRLESIFDSYEQASASTAREFGGTGLGLAISRELAMLMGGRIWATSVLGIGSTFRLWLPLPFEADPLEEPAPPSSTVVDFESLRVLVAEDHPVNQEVIRLMLEPLGIKPIIAGDGRAAVEAWRQADWDLVLMDIQMPVMDGLEAVALIRAEEARAGRPPTPVIALTANAMSHQIEEYVAAGMSGCVAKPLEFALLVEAMSAALGGASAAAGKHVHEAGPVGG